jgi:hypothetical protein
MTAYEKGFEDCKKQVAKAMVPAIEEAILMEREACAKLCDDIAQYDGHIATACAEAIRARWQK